MITEQAYTDIKCLLCEVIDASNDFYSLNINCENYLIIEFSAFINWSTLHSVLLKT